MTSRAIRATRWLGDALVTGLVLAAGVFLLVDAVRTFELSWWTLGVASAGFIVLLVGCFRAPGLLRRRVPTRVQNINGDCIELAEGAGEVDRRALRALGGRRDFASPWMWSFPARNDQALAATLSALRDLDIAFMGVDPSGWSPGDIFEDLRKRGQVSGSFREIVWHGPGQWEVRPR